MERVRARLEKLERRVATASFASSSTPSTSPASRPTKANIIQTEEPGLSALDAVRL
jgi:hypothetical protein